MENSRKAAPYDCLICHRPFCQRCSQVWHPNLTCDLASAQRAAQDPTLEMLMKSNLQGGQIRPCPRCKCFDLFEEILFHLSLTTSKKNREIKHFLAATCTPPPPCQREKRRRIAICHRVTLSVIWFCRSGLFRRSACVCLFEKSA